jgi:curved DNA-binding protein CbpA
MQNCYAALGVTHDVTPQVAKIAFEGKMKALAKAGLSEAERRAEERLLAQAYATLSNPAKKDWYDKQWMKHGEREEEVAIASTRRGWTVAAVMSVLFVGAISYYYVSRANERERLRLDAVRIANEKEAADKRAALEQAALDAVKDADAARIEYANRVQTARERAYSDSLSRSDQARANAEQYRARSLEISAERQVQVDEQRARMQDDANRRQAQADLERQKRFIAQREYEEQRAAAEREARVRYEADRRAREAAIAARQNANR